MTIPTSLTVDGTAVLGSLTANNCNMQSLNSDSVSVKDLFASDGLPFIATGTGVDIDVNPVTGQHIITSTVTRKLKFIAEVPTSKVFNPGEYISIPGLDMSEQLYDDTLWDIFLNGYLQVRGDDADFTIDSSLGIAFNFELEQHDRIIVSIIKYV